MINKKRAVILRLDDAKPTLSNTQGKGQGQDYSIYNNEQENSEQQSIQQMKDEQSSFELEPDEKKSTQQDQKNIQKLLDRLGLKTATNGPNKNQELQLVVNNFVENCIQTVDHQANLEEYDLAYDHIYQDKLKMQQPYVSSIYISELTQLQSIFKLSQKGLAWIYRSIMLAKRYTSMSCQRIVEHPIFEAIILVVIMLNSIKMATDDPLSTTTSLPWAETSFTAIYVTEMTFKIIAYGFIFNKGAYLRDSWNIMDFSIVVTSLLPIVITLNFSVNALRAFRVLRPLRTITKIRALKMIMKTLFYSFSLVMDSIYILLFVIFVFAIAGMQLFGGNLKYVCMDQLTGALTSSLCSSNSNCGSNQLCVKGISSPNFSVINFDTLLWSALGVFQSITMQGWSSIMVSIQMVSGTVYCIYSLLILFICEYVLLNMTMAILKYKYSQVKGNVIEEQEEEKEEYQPEFLKKIGVFNSISVLSKPPVLVRANNPSKHRVGCTRTLPPREIESSVTVKELLAFLNQEKLSSKVIEPQVQGINFEELKQLGKLAQHKWDAKQLQFQTNNLSQKEIHCDNPDEKPQSDKTLEGKEVEESYLSESYDSDDDILSESDDDSEEFEREQLIQTKALEAQEKLRSKAQSEHQKNEVGNKPIAEVGQMESEYENGEKIKKEKPIIREISELDKLLSLIGGKAGTTTGGGIIAAIPQVDLQQIIPERVFERFADLGDFSLKRDIKANELKLLDIRAAQKKLHKESKRKHLPVQAAIQESALDLKELHLKNELEKKELRCRVKPDDVIDKLRRYDVTRVAISMRLREVQEKKEEIQENMSSLFFHVRYLPNSERKNAKSKPSIFARNLQSEKLILKLPQFAVVARAQSKREKSEKSTSQKSHSNMKYLRMLQNYQMEDRIELTFDRVNATFFKSERPRKKQVETVQQEKNPQDEYQQIYEEDILKRHGYLQLQFPVQGLEEDISNLNMRKEEYEINIRGVVGFWRVARKQTLLFVSAPFYDNFVLLIVMANTILMAMSGFVNTDGDPYSTISLAFSILFAIDLGVKVFAYGIAFFSDVMNLFDSAVVVISLVEITLGGSNLSALRSIRILRAFRVLRITRLIRSLSYMRIIMNVITSVINEFVYVFLLLFLFIFIFTLLGMQIFGGAFVPQSVSGVRQNFNTFFSAFFIIFQVMTVQNWNDIQTATCLSSVGPWGVLFLISWIFLGNWILLSLLQAILLDGFDDDSTNPEEELGQDSQLRTAIEETNEEESTTEIMSEQQEEASEQSTKKEINLDADDASLFIFKPQHPFRRFAIAVTSSTPFEVIMFIIILCSSGKLALDTYIDGESEHGGQILQISQMIDFALNFIFIGECLLKVIARGFISGEDTYLKSSWNRLDFFIVCVSIVDMMLSGVNLSIIKLMRTLRPLRIITRNEEMKVMITSLLQSILGIFNLLIIVMCVYLMFAILAMNLLQQKLGYCNVGGEKIVTGSYGPYGIDYSTCIAQGGVWATQLINFENIASSMLSLYVFSTRENWPFYVYTFIDASDSGPIQDNNQILYFGYSILFIFICSLFFMDLLIGVLFTNYHEAQAKICPQPLSNKQINWKNLQKLIIEEDPAFQLYIAPQDPIRKFIFSLVSTKAFEIGIALVIIFNIFVMALNNDDLSKSTSDTFVTLNSVCSFIFIAELGVKLITFGRAYFLSAWNVFDFFVVSASVLDLILHYSGMGSATTSTLSLLPQIARIFRVLRITRLLRMLKRFKGLQKLIQTFVFSLPAIAKAFSILFLYLFICSILASNLMGNIAKDYSGNMSSILNYSDFHNALQTLFVNLSGENWYMFMFFGTTQGYAQCTNGGSCSSPYYYLFWLPFQFFGQKVFLQLFVLIVLDQFEANYINQHNPLGIFSLYEDDFREKWIEITSKYHSEKIETKCLINLMLKLRPPLGLGREETLSKYKSELGENDKLTPKEIEQKMNELDQKLKKNAAILLNKMNLPKSRIYFGYHETLYNFIKLATVPEFIAEATVEQLKLMDQMHKESQQALDKLKPSGNLFYYGELQGEEDQLSVPLNPISLILFTQMIVKGWHNYSLRGRRSKTKEERYNPFDSLNDSCASDLNEAQYEKIPPQKRIAIRRGGLMENKITNRCEFQPTISICGAYQDGKKAKNRLSKSNRNSKPKNSVRRSSKINIRNEKKKTIMANQEDSLN